MNKALLPNSSLFRLVCLLLCIGGTLTTISAQFSIERELIGATTVVVSPPSDEVAEGGLLVDASSGEPLIGYTGPGAIEATIGFQQTFMFVAENPATRDRFTGGDAPDRLLVSTYPNPTTEEVIVDLSEAKNDYQVLRLLGIDGVTVQVKAVINQQRTEFKQLSQLSAGTYYLQGIDANGNVHHLGSIVVLTRSN